MLDAWNDRDADAFASLFTADACVVGFDGSQMTGSEEIRSNLTAIFGSHSTASYLARVHRVRRVTPAAVMVHAVVGMVPPGESDINPAVNAVQSLLLLLDGADVRIAFLQNTPAAFHGRPELAEELTRELSSVLRSGRVVDDAGGMGD
jgi:uncharacterized protein (TIGR02246 family)